MHISAIFLAIYDTSHVALQMGLEASMALLKQVEDRAAGDPRFDGADVPRKSWMVYGWFMNGLWKIRETPIYKWMITGGNP